MSLKYFKNELIDKSLFFNENNLIKISSKFENVFSANDLSRWMDTVSGHTGGWFHRAKHGHDLIISTPAVFREFGFKGVIQFPFELLKDMTTKHGIPLPGSQVLVNSGLLTAKFVTNHLSFNLVDSIFIFSKYKSFKSRDQLLKDYSASDYEIAFSILFVAIDIYTGFTGASLIGIFFSLANMYLLSSHSDRLKSLFINILNWLKTINFETNLIRV